MDKILRFLWKTNLWLQPIALTALFAVMIRYIDQSKWSMQLAVILFALSFVPTLAAATSANRAAQLKADHEKQKASYPAIPKELQRRRPNAGDIVFGKDEKYYVCNAIAQDGHYLIIGGSGSGKSSCIIIPCLLNNPDTRIFALDIKGELSQKSIKNGQEYVRIINPQDKTSVGYDPFFLLNKDSNDQQIFETMQMIAFSLIPMSAATKDPFWKNSARNLCIGLLVYFYHQGMTNLVSIAEEILSRPVRETVLEVMQNTQPTSNEYRHLVQFSDMADETLSGVFAEMANALTIFTVDHDIQYVFRDNPCRANPHMLEEGYHIFLVIKEEKLAAYYNVLQLMLNQTLSELEKRPEDAEPILFLADELPRILSAGKLEKLLDASKTLRSRKVRLILVTQSLEALCTAYSENEAMDLLSNCNYKVILDTSSIKTQKMVCEWVGKYKERKLSDSRGKTRQRTTSYEETDILHPSDLITLAQSGEAILISPYGYNRIKKCPYYQDAYLKPIADEIVAYNRTIAEIQLLPK